MKPRYIALVLVALVLILLMGLTFNLNKLAHIRSIPTVDKIILPTDIKAESVSLHTSPIKSWSTLSPPIKYPNNLDEMYLMIDTQQYGWKFTPCHYYLPAIPWRVAREIAQIDKTGDARIIVSKEDLTVILRGTGIPVDKGINVSENEMFGRGIQLSLKGEILICGDKDGYPVFYGTGVKELIRGD